MSYPAVVVISAYRYRADSCRGCEALYSCKAFAWRTQNSHFS